jgi:hypothetical protein
MGCVIQAGLGQNVARQAAVKAGVPIEVPAETVNNVCGSGLKCVNMAAAMVMAGDADIVVAGGMENMSMAPYALMKARFGYRMNNSTMIDTMVNDALWDAFNNYHMGITAENVAAKYDISREAQDEFAAWSQNKAEKAQAEGRFDAEIVPVPVKVKKDIVDFVKDEAEEEARKEEVRELVVDAIALNEGLIKRLDNQHVDLLLKQCISHYVDNLSSDNHGANDMAASYVNYIKNHTDVYRSGFEYKVSLGRAENNAVHVVHDVKYKKHFKVASDRAYYLSCFFALQRGGLDAVMSDDSIFFREELLCESLIQNIQSILTNDDADTAKNKIID